MLTRFARLLVFAFFAWFAVPAAADCTVSGAIRQCIDTIEEIHVDATGFVYVWVDLDDEADLGCTLSNPGGSSTTGGLPLRTTNPMFDHAYQTLILAYSRKLRVDLNITLTTILGINFCTIQDVSLRP